MGFLKLIAAVSVLWLFHFSIHAQEELLPLRDLVNSETASARSRINALNDLAVYYLEHEPDTALKYARMALDESRPLDYRRGAANANHYLGKILYEHGAFSQALTHLFRSLETYQEIGDREGEAEVHNVLGMLHYYTGQPDRSLEHYQQALQLVEEEGLIRERAITIGNIGHFYEKQADYERALRFQENALMIYDSIQDPEGLSIVYGNLGSIYEDLENYPKARGYFTQALKYNHESQNKQLRAIHLNNLGDTYRKQGAFDEAIRYTRESLELAREFGYQHQEESALKDLATEYARLGDHRLAFAYLEEAQELYEQLYNEQNAQEIRRLQSLYYLAEKQQEIEILEQEKRIALITRNAFLGGLLMLILLGGIALSRQRLKIRKNRELHRAQQELIKIELDNVKLSEQQLKSDLEANSNQLTNRALHIIQKNKMLKDLKTGLDHLRQNNRSVDGSVSLLISKIDHNFNFDRDWEDFNQIFDRVHPEFYNRLNDKFPGLTASEIRLCALLRLNLDSKDTATILGISPDSLRINRYRLRKKLKMEKGSNLTTFIMNI